MSEELKEIIAGQPEDEKSEVKPLVETGVVAGGKVVETKDGKFVAVPDKAHLFESEKEAKAYEQGLKDGKPCHKPPHHGPGCGHKFPHPHHGICGMPKPKHER